MRIYVCCPDSDCGTYQHSMRWFNDWGIEPSTQWDDDLQAHYLEFAVPTEWSNKRRAKFIDALHRRTINR